MKRLILTGAIAFAGALPLMGCVVEPARPVVYAPAPVVAPPPPVYVAPAPVVVAGPGYWRWWHGRRVWVRRGYWHGRHYR